MSGRAKALQKIERLYGLIETMHSVALQEAAARVHEAEAAIAVETGLVRESRVEEWAALTVGDRARWAVADAQRAGSGRRQESLEEVRVEREAATEAAREVFLASRIQHGQMKAVVDAAVEGERVAEDRRAQSVADDRFLSRLRWNGLQPNGLRGGADGPEERPA